MNMPYTTDAERRALTADRQRAARPLVDLLAGEQVDLAVRPALTLCRPRLAWPWAGVLRVIRSLSTPALHRPRSLTEECA